MSINPPTLYTMSTTTPGSWQQFLNLLRANPDILILDLRSRVEPLTQDEATLWNDVAHWLHVEGVPEDRYTWLGQLLPENMNLPVHRLRSILLLGSSAVCLDRSPIAKGSLRQQIALLTKERIPDLIHKELAWQNTPLRDEPNLVLFLCGVYGDLQNIQRVEVEVEDLSGGYQGTPHYEATEVRVYGQDGHQRLPDFTLPYWQETLSAYVQLFEGDTTVEDKIKSVQEFLDDGREYLESGLDWPGQHYGLPMVFDLSPLLLGQDQLPMN